MARNISNDALHVITVPAPADAFPQITTRELTYACSCGTRGGTGRPEDLGFAIVHHLDPVARADTDARERRFLDSLGDELDRLQPYADAIARYAPLFAETEHTGGGCCNVRVTIGEPSPRSEIVVLSDWISDDGWYIGVYRDEAAWAEGEPTMDDADEPMPLVPLAAPDAVAAALVKLLQSRQILPADVAMEGGER